MAVYPFVADVWRAIGREAFLHDEVHLGAIRRRLLSVWGQREIVEVAARAAVRTLRSLEVLKENVSRSRLQPGEKIQVPTTLVPWILHALCLARGVAELDVREANSAPELFMLVLPGALSREYPFLERVVEGGDRTLLRLRSPFQLQATPVLPRGHRRPTR
jgi:hypothetical protein